MTIWFFVPAAISVVLSALLVVWAGRALPRPPTVEGAIIAVLVTTLLTFGFAGIGSDVPRPLVAVATIAWLVLLFTYPDGRIVPAWTAIVLVAAVAGVLTSVLFGDPGWLLLASFGTAFAAGVVGQIWRYRRRSSVAERQATKWVLVGLIPAATVFLGIGLLASTTSLGSDALEQDWYLFLSTVAIWAVPWCAAVGILAPERGRADPIVHALIVGCGSALILVLAYFIAEPLLGPRAAAAVTAILVLPTWLALRRVATRLVYARDPAGALAKLGDSLEHAPQPTEVAVVVAQSVVDGLAVPYVMVTLASGRCHAVGSPGGAEVEAFPVAYAGEPTATIAVAPRAGELRLAEHDRATLRRLARSAGPALHAAVTLERLQAAREELVLAREEERRRLRRDLHDDLAPSLAALGLRAASTSALLERDPNRARDQFVQLQAGIAAAVERVHDIAYDLRPPILDDLGLMAAIRDRVEVDGSGPNVVVQGQIEERRLPAAVQLAALRIVQEAVSNVRSHAAAATCTVELVEDQDWLTIRVTDDGAGIPAGARRGVGSRSMEERASELGGRIVRRTGPTGTTVEAWLPLAGAVA